MDFSSEPSRASGGSHISAASRCVAILARIGPVATAILQACLFQMKLCGVPRYNGGAAHAHGPCHGHVDREQGVLLMA
jgi:hypothetical protein